MDLGRVYQCAVLPTLVVAHYVSVPLPLVLLLVYIYTTRRRLRRLFQLYYMLAVGESEKKKKEAKRAKLKVSCDDLPSDSHLQFLGARARYWPLDAL